MARVNPIGNGVIKSLVKDPTKLKQGDQWHVVDDDDVAHMIRIEQELPPNSRGERRVAARSTKKGVGIIKETRESRWFDGDTIYLDDF